MYHRVLLLILCFVLTGCASNQAQGLLPAPAPSATPASPATVHEQFIQALQNNDRHAALERVGTIQFKEGLVDTWLHEAMALQRPSHFTGKFVEVRMLPPTEQGQGYTAISVWQHEAGVDCYRANLAQTEATWHVIHWASMGLGTCPKP